MGLDMYLYRKTYVGHYKDEAKVMLSVPDAAHDAAKKVKSERVKYVIEEVAYWRKANAIHKWFVDNLADGVDECQEIPVSRKHLQELIDLCIEVKNNHDKPPMLQTPPEDLLPTTSGFFFGSTEYDGYYYEDIDLTIEQLQAVLSEDPDEYSYYYYRASW
jgi:hypothetical protein